MFLTRMQCNTRHDPNAGFARNFRRFPSGYQHALTSAQYSRTHQRLMASCIMGSATAWAILQMLCTDQADITVLQGLNIGGGGGATQEIKVRVRKAGDDSSFYPYDFILGTMLHEITHNVHGPHDAAFYKMLDTLTEVHTTACIREATE